MRRNPADPLEIGVLFGDPRLPYPYRLEGRLSEEDFEDIRRLKEALEPLEGFRFTYFDDHLRLYEDLRDAAPDLVLNLCDTGYRNVVRHDTLVAALLEILDIPFTGAGSFSMGLSTDKSMVRALAMGIGIPVPNETFVDLNADPLVLPELYPALIKPNAADGSVGITRDCVVHDDAEAQAYLERLRDQLVRPQALIQDFLTGTEYTVGLIGNPGDFTVLPPLEIDYSHLDPGCRRSCRMVPRRIRNRPTGRISSFGGRTSMRSPTPIWWTTACGCSSVLAAATTRGSTFAPASTGCRACWMPTTTPPGAGTARWR